MVRIRNYIPAAVLVTAFVLFVSCGKGSDTDTSASKSPDIESVPPLAVEVLEAERGSVVPFIEASGTVSGIREAFAVSETRGIIKKVGFSLGDIIPEGSVLLNVDDSIALLSMEQSKEQYEAARLDLQTAETFYRQGNASAMEVARAKSAVNGAKAAYETALKVFEDNSVKSPISGAVAWKSDSAEIGNYITPGMKLARIVDMSSVKIYLSVGERQVSMIDIGAEAEITVASACADKPLKGSVKAVAAGSDLETGGFSVVVEAVNTCGKELLAGMSASVTIRTSLADDFLIVPSGAVINREGREYVMIDSNGTAEAVEISSGRSYGERVQVLSGLKEKDLVIITGLTGLAPGRKVLSRTAGSSGDWF